MAARKVTAAAVLAAAAAALAVLTACGTQRASSAAATAAPVTHAAARTPVQTATPTPSPAATLTTAQAKTTYLKIVDPENRGAAALNTDFSDSAPFGQLRAAALAEAATYAKVIQELRVYRWPTAVQPYVTAITLTDLPAGIRCDQAIAAAGSISAANAVNDTGQSCEQPSEQNASEIRQLLGLPGPP